MPQTSALAVDLTDFASRIDRAFAATADKVEERGGDEAAIRIREARRIWRKQGPKLDSAHAMAQHALDTTVLTGAGLDGRLTDRWRELAERHGPIVTAPLEGDLPDTLTSVSPLRLARTIALTLLTPDNTDLEIDGGRARLADLAASIMWSDAARDAGVPTTLERLSNVVKAAVDDAADIERAPGAPGPQGQRLPETRRRLGRVVAWLTKLADQHPSTALARGSGAAPWWLRLGAAMIILVALSQLLAALGEEAARASKR